MLRNDRNRKLVLTGALAVATIASGAFSMALFTDEADLDGAFDSGTIVLGAATADSLAWASEDMLPGDTSAMEITVSNDGTGDLRYSLAIAADNDDTKSLHSKLSVEIRGADLDIIPDGDRCNDRDGEEILVSTALDGAGFGSVAAGEQSGDRDLASDADETLCFLVSFDETANDDYQDAQTTATLTFTAEQTANNE